MGIKIPEICWTLSDLISVLISMNSWFMQFAGCHIPVATEHYILDYRTSLYCSVSLLSTSTWLPVYFMQLLHSIMAFIWPREMTIICSTATHWGITFWRTYHLDPIFKNTSNLATNTLEKNWTSYFSLCLYLVIYMWEKRWDEEHFWEGFGRTKSRGEIRDNMLSPHLQVEVDELKGKDHSSDF